MDYVQDILMSFFLGGVNSMFFRHRKTCARRLCFDEPEQLPTDSDIPEEFSDVPSSSVSEEFADVPSSSVSEEFADVPARSVSEEFADVPASSVSEEFADVPASSVSEEAVTLSTESATVPSFVSEEADVRSESGISEITTDTCFYSNGNSYAHDELDNSFVYDCMKEDKRLQHLSKWVMYENVINRIVQNIALILFLQDNVQYFFEYQQMLDDLYFIYFDIEKIKEYCNKRYFLDIMQQTILRKIPDICFYKEKYETVEPTLDNIRNIMEKIQVPTKEKDDRAHVMTPIFLVKQMMQNVPTAFWKNTTKRVLDPCCGYGVFTLVSFMKFNDSLSEKIPNHEKRVRWIIEKCLFFSDLVSYNVKVTKLLLRFFCNQIAGKDVTGLQFNSFVGNVLTIPYPCSFDLIATNPPFHRKQNNCGKKGGGDAIWDKIVMHCTEKLLRRTGMLVVVHPAGWRKPKSKYSKFTNALYDLYTKKYQLLFLSIHDTKEGQQAFHCGTRFDIVCLEKTRPYQKTAIVDQQGVRYEIDSKKWPWLPNSKFHQIKSLIAKRRESTCEIIYSATKYESRRKYVSSTRDETFVFRLIHGTPKRGTRKMYSNRNDLGHFGISKVIFGDSGIYNAIIDMDGEYGMTQHAMAIRVSSRREAKAVKRALESPEFRTVLQSCSWSNFQIDWRMFQSFKKDWYKNFA